MPGGLHARFCHTFQVYIYSRYGHWTSVDYQLEIGFEYLASVIWPIHMFA